MRLHLFFSDERVSERLKDLPHGKRSAYVQNALRWYMAFQEGSFAQQIVDGVVERIREDGLVSVRSVEPQEEALPELEEQIETPPANNPVVNFMKSWGGDEV